MKKISAFTLIETLIAISVFCVGILTVLFWVSKTLRNQDYAALQIKSAFFTREWLELLYNLRDANYHKEQPWNCIFNRIEHLNEEYNEGDNPFCDKLLMSWTVLKLSLGSNGNYIDIESSDTNQVDIEDFTWMFEKYQIYFHTWNLNWNTWFYYNHTWEKNEETWFARYLLIKPISIEWDNVDADKLLKVEAHVLYKKWELTWEKVMETFIWNYEF